MPLSHTCTDGATGNRDHLDQILSDLGTELGRLSERAPAEQDFERFEGELHQIMAAAERALLAHELEQLDVDRPAVTIVFPASRGCQTAPGRVAGTRLELMPG